MLPLRPALFTGLVLAGLAVAQIGTLGCSSGPDLLDDNSGVTTTTQPGEQLTEQMFLGKWDLDGERTNTANGAGGVTDIPSDVVKDVLGAGWKFQPGGVMRVDSVIGTKPGSWKIEGKDTLYVKLPDGVEHRYTASFDRGYLKLQEQATKRWFVFERDKFFGF